MPRAWVVPAAAAALVLTAASAQAQVIDRIREGVEKGLDRAVQGVAKRYNLDDQQASAARKLFADRIDDYLNRHGERIEKLAAELKDRFQPGQFPNPEDLKDVLEKVMPLLQDTRKHFNESADQFRGILNEEQRKVFDGDKANLDQAADQVFKALESGDPLRALLAMRAQGGFGFGLGGGGPAARASRLVFTGTGFIEREWDMWLERAAKAAKMTEEQFDKSKDILKLAKEAAAEYRRAKEEDFKRVAADLRGAGRDRDKRAAAEKAAEELTRPLEEIAKKWQADVLALLSEEQRKAAMEANRQPGR